ncbi:hypothetical protein [Modicisalibacter sp. 'Wilcox']|uniref:hypothetical protein n=1 Tax=Modicisalibacter sp. 'Wilcox' TaxID=2679914 RepID=UPI0013D11329|nr:hypothetical protein [Modicisalibacter sp. 'Wilcox']
MTLCRELGRLVRLGMVGAEEGMVTRAAEPQAALCLAAYRQLREQEPELSRGICSFCWSHDYQSVMVGLDGYAIDLDDSDPVKLRALQREPHPIDLGDGACVAFFQMEDSFVFVT